MPKYGPKAQKTIEKTMHEYAKGKLKSSSGKKVTGQKQAVAIGISKARKKGAKVPRKNRRVPMPPKRPFELPPPSSGASLEQAGTRMTGLMRKRLDAVRRLQERVRQKRLAQFRRLHAVKAHLIIDVLADLEGTPQRRHMRRVALSRRLAVDAFTGVGSVLRFRPNNPLSLIRSRFGRFARR